MAENGMSLLNRFRPVKVMLSDVLNRTIDVLRQLTVVPNVSQELVETARAAIDAINRQPIDID